MFKRLMILLLSSWIFLSCANDEYTDNGGIGDGTARVRISFSIKSPEKIKLPKSTSPGVDQENLVGSFQVFLFDKNNEIVKYGKSLDGSDLSLDPFSGEYKICLITNYGTDLSAVKNYAQLQELSLAASYIPQAGTTEGDLASGKMIMYGEDDITLEPRTEENPNLVEVEVERIFAKLKFKIYNELDKQNEDYKIEKVTLHNGLKNSWLLPHDTDKAKEIDEDPIILYNNPTGVSPTESTPLTMLRPIEYIFENRAGTVATGGTEQKNKGEKAEGLTAPAYIEITGKYQKENGVSISVTQKVYLGQNNHSDFNVNRNEYHDYDIKIKSEGENDTRVTIKSLSEMNFISSSVPQDAHYLIYPIKIESKNAANGWTVASNQQWVTLRTDLTDLQQQGYWIEEDKGSSSITGSNGDDITIYAILEENAAVNARERQSLLTLYETGTDQSAGNTFTIKQLPVNWTGDLGNERIEDYTFGEGNGYPWGFNWTRKVTYQSKEESILIPWTRGWYKFVIFFYQLFGDKSISTKEWDEKASFLTRWYYLDITIDYSSINNLSNNADDNNDGFTNTWNLYSGGAGMNSTNFENYLKSRLELIDENKQENVEYYAAKMCLQKNKFSREEHTDPELGEKYYIPVIKQDDVKWFLPARYQIDDISESGTYKLEGTYWTSTAISPDKAYKYTVGGDASAASRNDIYKVRAVRKR
ncbi:DUF4906 domain-containing protein [Dysgonomonas sp. 521]|uniref:DUF4906 domain-containing protein n=1 Tax=Dysgonomonas sp. 521 TaxID=2302932 RepID=UPI0013D09747|nr:DUF4906 domain-containing protein [Dysgonomonas sp. 521]